MSTKFWFHDPIVLIKNLEVWPGEYMNFARKLNAISRLIILLSIGGYLYTKNMRIIVTGVVTLGVIIFLYQQQNALDSREGFTIQDLLPSDNDYYIPNSKNPLSNVLLPEIQYDSDRKAAPPAFSTPVHNQINQNVKKMIQEQNPGQPNIDKKLFKDLGDTIEFDNSMLQFNSNPSTQIPNDQNAFAKYCYGDMPSCKAGDNVACNQATGSYLPEN